MGRRGDAGAGRAPGQPERRASEPERLPRGEFVRRILTGGLEAWVWRREGFQNSHAVLAAGFGAADLHFRLNGRSWTLPAGSAHFLEHVIFEPEQEDAPGPLARLGVRSNAFTSHSVTAYYFSGPDNFAAALRRLLRLVAAPQFTAQGVERERRVIAEEIRMHRDDPEARVIQNLLGALYARHPVRRPVVGTPGSIRTVTVDILLACHQAFYHPSNLVLAAAGDLDPDRIFEAVEEELGRAEAGRPAPRLERVFPAEPALPARTTIRATMPVRRPWFVVGWKDFTAPTGRDGPGPLRRGVVMDLLLDIVLGPTSTLFTRLYRDGLVDDTFWARYSWDRTFAYALAGGATRDPDRAAARLLEGISARRQKGIGRAELERKRRKALGQFAGLSDSLEGLATLFALHRLQGVDVRRYPAALAEVTAEEIDRASRELLIPERLSVSILTAGPASGGGSRGITRRPDGQAGPASQHRALPDAGGPGELESRD